MDQANVFTEMARKSRRSFGWPIKRRQARPVELLGPLSIAFELESSVWGTVTMLPTSTLASTLRLDLFAKDGRQPSKATIDRLRWNLEQDMTAVDQSASASHESRAPFVYECGGK